MQSAKMAYVKKETCKVVALLDLDLYTVKTLSHNPQAVGFVERRRSMEIESKSRRLAGDCDVGRKQFLTAKKNVKSQHKHCKFPCRRKNDGPRSANRIGSVALFSTNFSPVSDVVEQGEASESQFHENLNWCIR